MSTTFAEKVVEAITPVETQSPYNVLTPALREISDANPKLVSHEGAEAMLDRWVELGDPFRALLAGVLMDPSSRRYLNDRLDRFWANSKMAGKYHDVPEVIVGSGPHAAIYCATRAMLARRMGRPHVRPLVLEASAPHQVGGAFAVTRAASFFLNSRNRSGDQGVPGEGGALNLMPNAPLQPFDITNTEYQTNTSMADVIRATLALYADVVPGLKVEKFEATDPYVNSNLNRWKVYANSKVFTTDRLILATGLGPKNSPFRNTDWDDLVLGYMEFMARMDLPFPLQGFKKVAVIGAGDGAKTVIEALLGKGPQAGMSVPSMDRVDKIDWYGVGVTASEDSWCQNNRDRYRGIGRYLRNSDYRVLRPRDQAGYLQPGSGVVYVDGRPYDHVVIATGFSRDKAVAGPSAGGYVYDGYTVGRRFVAQKLGNDYQARTESDRGVYAIGPAAALSTDSAESLNPLATRIGENSTAMFRYAPRTAALAASFPLI